MNLKNPVDVRRRNRVIQRGSGSPTLLFAHGFGCDQSIWRFVAPAFEATHQVVTFDYVGAGGSDLTAYDPHRYATLDGYAQDVLDICEALGEQKLVFVGHSISGMIGALAAVREPVRFEHLIMIGASPCYLNDPPDYIGGFDRSDINGLLDMMEHNFSGWSERMAPIVVRSDTQSRWSEEMRLGFDAMDPRIARRWAREVFLSDHRDLLPEVKVPTLVLQSSDDVIVPFDAAVYLQAHLPRATLRVLKAVGHCPSLTHPDETITAIRNYLEPQCAAG